MLAILMFAVATLDFVLAVTVTNHTSSILWFAAGSLMFLAGVLNIAASS